MLDKGTAARPRRPKSPSILIRSAGGSPRPPGEIRSIQAQAVLRADFSQAVAILADSFLHPTFPQDQFDKVKSLTSGMIAARSDDPHQELMELFADSLPESSPYHIIPGGKVETVRTMTVEDLRAYHARYFVPEKMIVSVFGDIDPETALATVRKHFGGLKAPGVRQPSISIAPTLSPATWSGTRRRARRPAWYCWVIPIRASSTRGPCSHGAPGCDYVGLPLSGRLAAQRDSRRGFGLFRRCNRRSPARPRAILSSSPRLSRRRLPRSSNGSSATWIAPNAVKSPKRSSARRGSSQLPCTLRKNTTVEEQARLAAIDELYGLGYDYDKTFDSRIEAVSRENVIRAAQKYLTHYILATTSPQDESGTGKDGK